MKIEIVQLGHRKVGLTRRATIHEIETRQSSEHMLNLQPGGLSLNAASLIRLHWWCRTDAFPDQMRLMWDGNYFDPWPMPRDNRWHIRTLNGFDYTPNYPRRGDIPISRVWGRLKWRVLAPVFRTEHDTLRELSRIIDGLPNGFRGWAERGDEIRDELVQLRREITIGLLGGV